MVDRSDMDRFDAEPDVELTRSGGFDATVGPDAADRSLAAGSTIGQYTVEQTRSVGAAGTLYAARDGMGASVLVRLLDPEALGDSLSRERIAADLFALRAIQHPSVSRVLAVGIEAGRPFYALADRAEQTLADAVRQGRTLDEPELVWLGRELAGGLDALHRGGLVHGGVAAQTVTISDDHATIDELDWFARLSDEDRACPEDDVAGLGRVLCFAATGAASDAASLRRASPGFREEVLALLEALEGGRERPTAARALEAFTQVATAVGVGAEPPRTLRNLMITRLKVAPAEQAAAAPPIGRFGRYELLEEVARGGMGVVYRARHAEFERIFALKVMLTTPHTDDVARRRFVREAEAAAALDHPAIVPVHDVGEVEGRGYIAMDFAEGRRLGEVHRDAGVSLEALVRIMVQVVRAVHYAHSRGIVHRDLKPENILVDDAGRPRILDFGIAKRLDDANDRITAAGELVGTPAYMPPEQAEGRSRDIDTRSDVYSLGVTLCEVVTRGRLPFEGESVTDLLSKMLLDEPARPSALRADVPWELDAIVLKAIEKEPDRRYQSAAELADDLERYLEGKPIRARQATWSHRAWKWTRRRWPTVVASLLLVGTLSGAAAADALRRRADVEAFVRRGDDALARGDVRGAHELFLRAIALDPEHVAALVGRERALRQAELEQRGRQARDQRAQAEQHIARAMRALEELRLDEARAAFEQAMAFDGCPSAAADGLRRVERLLASREAMERTQSQEARDRALASEHEAAGLRHLEAGDHRAAQAAFIKAIAFGSPRAEELLRRAEDALVVGRVRAAQDEVATSNAIEAARLAASAQVALERGALGESRTLFLQALALDGRQPAALDGLLELERRTGRTSAGLLGRAGAVKVDELVTVARDRLEQGRRAYRDGHDPEAVREAYLAALQTYDVAVTLASDDRAARAEMQRVARELSAILRDDGKLDLAESALRMAGLDADTISGPQDLPLDPHLVVLEADRVQVRRALQGEVRFQPSRAFDALRARVRLHGDRWRVTVLIRSRATMGFPPAIHCTGLQVKLEDRRTRTVLPPILLELEEGPQPRRVSVTARGRVVDAFDRTPGVDVGRCVRDVERAVMAAIESTGSRALARAP